MRFAVVAQHETETNARLAAASRRRGIAWACLTPSEALATLRPGDVALGRLDVLPTLDGVDDGLLVLGELAARGIRVLNEPSALLAAHDKLLTARLLHGAGLPHLRTRLVTADSDVPAVDRPVVVKPRFGSWGRDVVRCEDGAALREHIERVADASWFRSHGALVQDLVPPRGFDLRLIVAAGSVVGSVRRVAAPGEWRTNVALGAHREPALAPAAARLVALSAASTAGAHLVGVDLLPDGDGWTIVELNGAVEFTAEYGAGHDVFTDAAVALVRAVLNERLAEPVETLLESGPETATLLESS